MGGVVGLVLGDIATNCSENEMGVLKDRIFL